MKKCNYILLGLLGVASMGVSVAEEDGQAIEVFGADDTTVTFNEGDEKYLKADPEAVKAWQDKQFGLFVHWGPSSQINKDLSWSRKGGRRWGERIQYPDNGVVPMEEYDALYKTFNPIDFDAKAWVEMMKYAGMKYVVFTAKHHDGFCMFDSAYTEYDIMSTPYGKDILKELADACHAEGIGLGIYYSPTDWHHPDFRTEKHDRYLEYYFNQMRELATNYGKVDVIWWDAIGFHGEPEMIRSNEMTKMLRELQPKILLNNRAALVGDFSTPENKVGRFEKTRPWESCMTGAGSWGYRPSPAKSLKKLVHTWVRCAGGNGNFLLNFGPMADGRFDPKHEARLRELGDWGQQFSDTLFDTRGGPYKPSVYGVTTFRDNKVFVHVLNWESKESLELPALPIQITGSRVITGGEVVVKQDKDGVTVSVAKADRDPINTIIELTLAKEAHVVEPIEVPYISGSLALNKPAKASSVIFNNMKNKGPVCALDDDIDTAWVADLMQRENVWLEVDLEAPIQISRIAIKENHGRTQKFLLQYKNGEEWVTFHEGNGIGNDFKAEFEDVTAQHVRILILKASAGPGITEFQVFGEKE